jgi:hypothetical protein
VLSEIDRVTSNHNFSNASATIIFDDAGNITSYDASIEHSDVGTIIGTIATLDASETNIIKDANTQINELENLVSSIQSASNAENVAKLALEYIGWSQLENITVDWDVSNKILTTNFDGLFEGEQRTDPTFTSSIGTDGELTVFSYTAGSPSGDKSLSLSNLNDTDLYLHKVIAKTVSDLDALEIAANHASLLTNKTNIIKDANTQINELENLVSSMQSATSMEDVVKVSLEYAGFSNLTNIIVNWYDDTSTATITFDGLFEGEERTNPAFTMTTGSDGELTAFSYTAGSPSGSKQLDLVHLNETQLYSNKVGMKAISDLYDLEQAANHTSLLTNDISFDLYKDGSDTNQDLVIDNGELRINESFNFDTIKISDIQNYTQDISIGDAIDVLRHIVKLEEFSTGSTKFHAADVNNDGNINISDAIDILRHIVDLEAIDSFDLIDTNGDRVTSLDANASGEAPTWTIVANGDANMSGSFDAAYVMSDIV